MKGFLSFMKVLFWTIGWTIVVVGLACEDNPEAHLSIRQILMYKLFAVTVGGCIILVGYLFRAWRESLNKRYIFPTEL